MSKIIIKGPVKAKHIGDNYIYPPQVQSYTILQRYEGTTQQEGIGGFYTGVALLLTSFLSSTSAFKTLFPAIFDNSFAAPVIMICAILSFWSSKAQLIVQLGESRFYPKANASPKRVIFKEDGHLMSAEFSAGCIYPGCDGEIHIVAVQENVEPKRQKTRFTAQCNVDPNEHTYKVDQNMRATPTNLEFLR